MKKTLLALGAAFSICANAQTPSWSWAKNIGNETTISEPAIATDGDGNVYVSGNFTGDSLLIGSTILLNSTSGSDDLFIAKYDNSGNVLWAKSFGSNGIDRVFSLVADADGNFYAAGAFNTSALTFGSTTLTNSTGGYDIFLVKFDASGNTLWAKKIGGSSNEFGRPLAIDAAANIYLTGYYYSTTLSFDAITLTNTGSPDFFVTKFDSSGSAQWARSGNGGAFGSETPTAIAVTISGDCYVTGSFNFGTSLIVEADTLTNAGNADAFLLKYSTDGSLEWLQSVNSVEYETASDVAVDEDGNFYFTGWFNSDSITFGSTTLLNSGTDGDIYLVKCDEDGNVLWARSAGGTGNDDAASVIVANGNCFIAGSHESDTFTIGTFSFTNAGKDDLYFAKYDANGNVLWAQGAGGSEYEFGTMLASDENGNVYIAGTFNSTSLEIGTTTLVNSGQFSSDIYFAKLEDNTTAVMEAEYANSFSLYPNPTAGEFSIQGLKFNLGDELSILDLTGRQIFHTQFSITISNLKLHASHFENGVYFVQVKSKESISTKKLIIQH